MSIRRLDSSKRTRRPGPPRPSVTRSRRGSSTSSVIIAAALLLMWGGFALGWYFAVVVSMLGAAAATVVLARRRPDITVSVVTAVLATAAPATLIAVGVNSGRPLSDVMPLAMFAFSGPAPTLWAWTFPPVISRPVNAIIGSLILLAGMTVQWFAGAAAAGVLYAALLTSFAVIFLRYHRALRRIEDFPVTDDGWTDIGRRILNAGPVQQLLVGHGRAVAVFHRDQPGDLDADQLQALVGSAVPLARWLRLPLSRVQPVVLGGRPGSDWTRELVNDGQAASYLPIGNAAALPDICAAFAADDHTHYASRAVQRWLNRHVIYRAAALGRPHSEFTHA